MEQHEFEIEIRKNGEVKVHIKGVKGKRCLDYVEFLKAVVGPVKEMRHTTEFYEPDGQVRIDLEARQRGR